MLTIETFTFNPYQENTYLLIDSEKNCVIIDPGMCNAQEQSYFTAYLENNNLKPSLLLNTHCHIDHVLGNHYVYETWGLKPNFHEQEIPVLVAVDNYAPQMGMRYETSPIPNSFIKDQDVINFGGQQILAILAPGHSPGHLCYYIKDLGILMGGDVLFRGSIGRTDLPGGDHQTLLNNIKTKIYTLPDQVEVYPGHGPATTIGQEKQSNPFVRG